VAVVGVVGGPGGADFVGSDGFVGWHGGEPFGDLAGGGVVG
jgi:hypothetical protein